MDGRLLPTNLDLTKFFDIIFLLTLIFPFSFTRSSIGEIGDPPFKYLENSFGNIFHDEKSLMLKERVLEMSASIKDAISVDTFLDVKHLGGAAAAVIADDKWF